MPPWLIYNLPNITILLFVTAVGACIGSLTNVLVYRMPLGLDVVTPTSRCPKCNHKLTWRENIPIFGWLILRGKCRFCKAKISPEYPIVETIVALLFGGIFALWYMVPEDAIFGLGQIAPEWAANGPALTWPAMVVLLVLVGSMVSMTIIDARTSTIPLVLTWVPALVALFLHTGHAIWFQTKYGTPEMMPTGLGGLWEVENLRSKWITAPGEVWTLATGGLGGWRFIGIGLGGAVGLILSNLMLKFGLLTRSFDDFEQWYQDHHETKTEEDASEEESTETEPVAGESESIEDWLMYPHARREMVRELAFLCLPVLLGLGGGWLMVQMFGHWGTNPETGMIDPPTLAPLWLVVLGGVLMGYLIAGAVVWAVRIGGTLAFGKEAMGLGDVHMMAAVGACLGWIDPTIAFFLAAFVGVAYAIVAQIFSGKLSRAMPYGPFLAVATMMVILGKPIVEMGLGMIFRMPGPLNLP
jgi:leader peptidase (prepilin peptidase) / N-methyltransferase